MKRIALTLAALALILSGLPQLAVQNAAAQAGNTYTNATYGYSVTWDDSVWFTVTQDDVEQGTDLLLSNGISFVSFVADNTVPAPPLCVTLFENGISGQEGISDVQPVNGPDGKPIRSTDPDRSYVALSFTVTTQGQTIQVTEKFECRTLVENQAVLIIDHFVIPADAYQSEVPLVETLLTGLTIPDSTATPTANQTPTPEASPTEQTIPTTAPTEIPATSTAGTTARIGEPGPVFVSDGWRFSVVAAVRSAGLNAIGLQRKDGKDWVVVVADLTNWTNAPASIVPRDIRLATAGGGSPVRAAPVSSGVAAEALGVTLTNVADEQIFRANQTRRVVLAYSINSDATDPAISFGTTLPLADVLEQDVDLENLPNVQRPPRLVQAEVDRVVDGDSLDVYLPDDDINLTVNLLNATAPVDNGCFADEAADRLNELAGSTVFLEAGGDDASSEEVNRYVWVEDENGARTQINHEMLTGGFAVYHEEPATRFATWLQEAETEARDANTGIWEACADDLPTVTAEATATPVPTETPTQAPTATPQPTEEPTQAPTATPTEEAAASPTATATEGTAEASPSASATTETPTSAMFRGGPSHSGIQPGPGLTAPAKLPWQFQTTSGIFSSPAIVDGVVYIGSLDGSMYALNSKSGPAIWQFTTGAGILSSPAVADGVVYFGSEDTNLYAVDAATGRERWRFATGAEVSSSPAVVDGIVYVGGMDTYVYAVNAETGDEVWKARIGQAFSSPTVVDGVVFIGAAQSIFAFDAKTGEEKWRAQTGGPVESSPAVSGGLVYIGNDAGFVVAVDQETGDQKWQFQASDAVISSPAVANGMVYFGSNDQKVYAVDAVTGLQMWVYETGDQVTSSPAVADGVVFIGSFDGYIYGLDAESGAERWHFQAGPILSSPSVVDGVVYFGSADGRILARQPFNLLNIS